MSFPLISKKCRWKQYRQPENGHKTLDTSALYEYPFSCWYETEVAKVALDGATFVH